MVVGPAIVLEGRDIGVKQGVIGAATGVVDVALVQLETDLTADALLRFVDHRLQHFALGTPPVAVVDQAGVTRHQLVLHVCHFAVQRQALDRAMRLEQQGTARCFVAAATLHADIAVLDDVEPTDTVLAGQLVEPIQQHVGAERFAIDRNRITGLEADRDELGFVRCVLGVRGPAPDVVRRIPPGIFQATAFVGDVQGVGVHRVR